MVDGIKLKVKSPLRFPGGKSRALKQILPIIPEFKEYREPMVGGGSVFFALIKNYSCFGRPVKPIIKIC